MKVTDAASENKAIRLKYQEYGVRPFYEQFGAAYSNPHEAAIGALLRAVLPTSQLDLSKVLDLACGSGEITLFLREWGCQNIEGIDPYTGAAYLKRTGQAAEPYTFEEIAAGALWGRHYSLIVCSFAMHLVEESRLPGLAQQLSLITDSLLVITPHKRPRLKKEWGWTESGEIVLERVRARLHKHAYK